VTLFTLIKEDFLNVKRNDPALHSSFELFFNYPGLWAVFYYRIANWLYKKGLRFLPRFISGIGQFLTTIDIHPASTIGERVFIDHGVGVVIGETAIIGNDVVIYQQVTLGGVNLVCGKRHPTIEDNVVIGAGARILGNITVGRNSKVGANSVVIKNVPSDSTAIGIPARVIKRGFDKTPLSHNKIPDINKEIFEYLVKRLAVLEYAVKTGDTLSMEKDDYELSEVYNTFIKSMD